MTPEEWTALIAELHTKEAHPSFEYNYVTDRPSSSELHQPPDHRDGWEPNPYTDADGEFHPDGLYVDWEYYSATRYWRRRTDNAYTGVMEEGALVVAAHKLQLHPHHEYRTVTLPIAIADVMESAQSFGQMLKNAIEIIGSVGGWELNTATSSGGFTLNGHELTLCLYRKKA